ncbi:MAG: alpha/beta hydrolase [Caulobacterales bacterium]|nr:alpha/beta hydrolase [Caulobacterales bacterium]
MVAQASSAGGRGTAGAKGRGRPAWALALAAAALLASCEASDSAAALSPGKGVRLPDHRTINFRCEGTGAPTVLLESGFGADSGAWFKVQPALARTTRVCAYDRAGYGYSDPGPLPRDGAAIARDLDQALVAARIDGPYVLVGHSAGGLYARLFAARRLQDVKGLVLLDPTVETHVADPANDGLEGIRNRVQRCLAAASASPQPPLEDPQWQGCIPARRDPHQIEVARRPDSWRNQLSELDAIFGRTSDQVMRMGDLLRPIPAYVITASDTAAAAQKLGYASQSLWELQHMRLAYSFDRGAQRTVLSSHLVMIDRPEVVIEAVQSMLAAIRAGRPPDDLPPSETAAPPGGFAPDADIENPGATK